MHSFLDDAMVTDETAPGTPPAPAHDCALCPRLADYRVDNQTAHPGWFNAPVPSWGPLDASLLIVGMAPGLKGANRTGRVFTGDDSGRLLSETLIKFGFARGEYGGTAKDGLTPRRVRITNAVRCVPPSNLTKPPEVLACNGFLRGELQNLAGLRAVLALGVLAHAAVLRACGIPQSRLRFRHGAIHEMPDGLLLADSFHVSRLNTATGRLTPAMFEEVVAALKRRMAR
jgi:uracil-DNA glycosylase family 4